VAPQVGELTTLVVVVLVSFLAQPHLLVRLAGAVRCRCCAVRERPTSQRERALTRDSPIAQAALARDGLLPAVFAAEDARGVLRTNLLITGATLSGAHRDSPLSSPLKNFQKRATPRSPGESPSAERGVVCAACMQRWPCWCRSCS
jgi:hypothetical protein